MRIAHCFRALIAVLGLAAVVIPVAYGQYFNETQDVLYDYYRHKRNARRQNKGHNHVGGLHIYDDDFHMAKKLHPHTKVHHPPPGECCPTVLEKVEPTGGSNQDGIYVELYQDQNYKQRFYDLSCHSDVLNKPCQYINRTQHASRCVQQYSYSYALVKNTDSNRTKLFPMFPDHQHGGATYTLDYIRIRSGCSCEVTAKRRRKKKNNNKGNT
ncbi:uncharacterized protein LOC114328350 [Diabrotica virgifera virgifera]|uniref:Uncharacterized protein LOC114328350 n=1 Tax=Diabrotica virgifera virgifera TaxID=50390 RepID=A0A6P7FBK6_DIAVI|nr:uncharacterized protein LOC114328350 [Diabrotica virgifera virgifera]